MAPGVNLTTSMMGVELQSTSNRYSKLKSSST